MNYECLIIDISPESRRRVAGIIVVGNVWFHAQHFNDYEQSFLGGLSQNLIAATKTIERVRYVIFRNLLRVCLFLRF